MDEFKELFPGLNSYHFFEGETVRASPSACRLVIKNTCFDKQRVKKALDRIDISLRDIILGDLGL